ncbi:MAG: hypothetical protein ABIJ12_12795 [bacterium]
MSYRRLSIFTIALLSLLLCSTVYAAREKKIKPPSKNIQMKHTNFTIAPYLTGGWIIGDGADYIQSNNKAIYGLGSTFMYNWKPKLKVFGNLEVVYGNVSDTNITKYRVLSYSGGLLYSVSPKNRSSLYFKGEFGNSKVRATVAKIDYGTHSFIKIGLGNRIFSTPTIATWIELYYKRIFNSDEYLEYYYVDKEIDAEYIGLIFSVSFGL